MRTALLTLLSSKKTSWLPWRSWSRLCLPTTWKSMTNWDTSTNNLDHSHPTQPPTVNVTRHVMHTLIHFWAEIPVWDVHVAEDGRHHSHIYTGVAVCSLCGGRGVVRLSLLLGDSYQWTLCFLFLLVCIWFRVSMSLKVPWPKHPSGRVLVGTCLMCMNMGSH